ncbi:MAG: Gfo/Idh/MocA family oxidoreductase [Elusimicrobia bacterium]|nr:Gfo/Idh/MocA family oxidoreductase [Elusimicrobiota bacterium]
MLKGAILGFGQVVEHGHVPAFLARSSSFEINAVADASPRRLEAAAALFPRARLYSDFRVLLRKERGLDFADIATPPFFHPAHVCAALRKGLHVLCEKPLAFTRRDARRIAALAGERKLCVATVHNWKKAAPVLKAKELIDSGALGAVRHVELHVLRKQAAATASDGANWRTDPRISGGGILVDHGWHNFYLACHLAGQRPVAVNTSLDRSPVSGADEDAKVLIGFDGGAGAFVHLTWKSPLRRNSVLVYGDRALLEINDDAVVLQSPDGSRREFATGDKLSGGSAHPEWMARLLDEFESEVADQARRGANLQEALWCASLLECGYRSAKANKMIRLETPAA